MKFSIVTYIVVGFLVFGAIAADALPLIDDFEDGVADGWSITWLGEFCNPTWTITSPGFDSSFAYGLTSAPHYSGGAVDRGITYVAAEANYLINNWVGDIILYPRFADEDNFVEIRLYPLGTDGGQLDAICVNQSGNRTTLATHARSTSRDEWHKLGYVQNESGDLHVYLDDQLYMSASNVPSMNGVTSVGIWGGGKFDDFRGSPVPSPATFMLLVSGLLGIVSLRKKSGGNHR